MTPPASDELVLIGRVGRPHGVQGEMKVVPITDDPHHLLEIESVFVGPEASKAERFTVRRARTQRVKQGEGLLLLLEDRTSREDAARLQGLFVYAHQADLLLDEDEFFLHDLIGLEVRLEGDDTTVGAVQDVLSMPAQDMLVIARPGRPDALVPLVDEFLTEIDVEAGWLRIRPIDGLLDG